MSEPSVFIAASLEADDFYDHHMDGFVAKEVSMI